MGTGFSGNGRGWISSSRGRMGMGINCRPRAALYSTAGVAAWPYTCYDCLTERYSIVKLNGLLADINYVGSFKPEIN